MRGLFLAAWVLLAAAGAANAEGVVCGKGWVSFTPYKYGTAELAPGSVLLRTAHIKQGFLHFAGSREGRLIVTSGYGQGPKNNTIEVPEQAYRAIMRCLVGD